MAVETARGGARGADHSGAHAGGCTCGHCPHGAREAHHRAVAAFRRRRDELAAGTGVPEGLAHSPEASRQWVSDELAHCARTVAERAREAEAALSGRRTRHTVIAVWSAAGLLALGLLLTAVGDGWSRARTAALLAAVLIAALLHLAAWLHRARGGLLAPLTGEDNRLSTSRTVAAAWLLMAVYAVLVIAGTLIGGTAEGDGFASGSEWAAAAAGLPAALALSFAVTVWVRHTVATRVRSFTMQKVRADRPRAADLLTDDAGRVSFTDVQYVAVNLAALVLAAVNLAGAPDGFPVLSWPVAVLLAVSALTYAAAKYSEGGRPVILSVVRAREPGDLPAPVRPGDDIEIRGCGFVPAGAGEPDRLARTVVRIGAVCVPVPLVPVRGGFRNPRDTVLTVPVPAEVEAGTVEVQVITAAGTESGRYPVTVTD
ncbi:hypothetical protein [Streptomyces sodiiphilus]|uniref:hypothetical protein n=1 Tax=Streptomyces sodiiphilus TaxID=226217 RepID=UPI0031D2B715